MSPRLREHLLPRHLRSVVLDILASPAFQEPVLVPAVQEGADTLENREQVDFPVEAGSLDLAVFLESPELLDQAVVAGLVAIQASLDTVAARACLVSPAGLDQADSLASLDFQALLELLVSAGTADYLAIPASQVKMAKPLLADILGLVAHLASPAFRASPAKADRQGSVGPAGVQDTRASVVQAGNQASLA